MKAKSGSIYKQKNSKFYWVQYYVPGQKRPVRESAKTESAEEAQAFLWKRLGSLGSGSFAGLEPERVKVNTLLDMLIEDYERNNRSSLAHTEGRVDKHLRPFFGDLKAALVGTRQVSAYVTKRRKTEGAKNATVNRELEHLRRAFNIGFKAQPQLVLRPLSYEKLEEDNVREGILEHDQYVTIRNGLPEPYKTLFICAYHLGTREGELLKVQWSEVNFERSEIVLLRYTTKSKKPRVLPIYGDMRQFLLMIRERQQLQHSTCPWVFQHHGRQLSFVHRLWKKMVKKLGSPDLLFHDLRRTAVTNMIDAGFSEKEAMEISGHKTDKTFRRYHIIRRARIQTLGRKMEDFYKGLNDAADIKADIATAKTRLV